MSPQAPEKEVRINLDQAAATALRTMIDILKAETSTVKVQPSQFVSFLVADFLEAHFAKDKPVFIAEFFDSDAYYEAERKKAKGRPDFEDLMARAFDHARKVKSLKRSKTMRRFPTSTKESEVKPDAAV